MADEKNGPRPLGDRPEDHDPSPNAVQNPASTLGQTGSGGPRSEWTASDERGALHQAPPSIASPARADDGDLSGGGPAARSSEAAPTASAEPVAKRSLWPVAVGVIVGAIVGAGSAAGVYYGIQKNGDTGLEQKVASLGSRVDTLDQRPDPQQAITGLKSSVSGLDGKVAEAQKSAAAAQQTAQQASQAAAKPATPSFDPAPLQQKIAALQTAVDDLRTQSGGKDVDGKLASLQAAIADLKTQDADQGTKLAGIDAALSELKKQDADQSGKIAAFALTAAGLQSLQGKVSGLDKQASTTQDSVTSLQGGQKTLEGKVKEPALAVVADSLVEQIARGEPYARQVDALASLNADPSRIAVLRENAEKGVPSAQSLAAQFKPLADATTAVEYKAPANSGFLDRLKNGMSSLVSVRGTDATTGTDTGSRVSLIEADLEHGDVAGAVATWNELPPDAKAKSQAWGALAKTSAEAMTAARALREQSIATLGGKKS